MVSLGLHDGSTVSPAVAVFSAVSYQFGRTIFMSSLLSFHCGQGFPAFGVCLLCVLVFLLVHVCFQEAVFWSELMHVFLTICTVEPLGCTPQERNTERGSDA